MACGPVIAVASLPPGTTMSLALPRLLLLPFASLLLAACATGGGFPPPVPASPRVADAPGETLDGDAVFARTLAAHGGDLRRHPGDINLSTDGRWYALIQRIQPLVSDSGFRIRSQERYRPADGLYVVDHDGPEGRKRVVRRADGLSIAYNGRPNEDAARRSATAMTNDAFRMFHFGPSWFIDRVARWRRLDDATDAGRGYRRIAGVAVPGFGDAQRDDLVLWIDRETDRLYRIHMSLNGFATTQGAHVDTTFLDYRSVGGYLFPVRFHERVRGPLRIDAHTWWVTGLDMDRGWQATDVTGTDFTGAAAPAAKPLDVPASP
jgi:hypothetical protein